MSARDGAAGPSIARLRRSASRSAEPAEPAAPRGDLGSPAKPDLRMSATRLCAMGWQ
jgi:hypothetical protein